MIRKCINAPPARHACMMPDPSQAYPYGPKGTAATDADYGAWYSRMAPAAASLLFG